jgi:uncharacterized FlaG/YvyC family protein
MDVLAIDKTGAAQPQPGLASSIPTAAITGFPPDPAQKEETLHKVLSQLVGSNVSVQFQVVAGTHDIITVFKNKDTGEVISQFPPEAMVLIAQFFNKLAGAVLDRTA